MITDTAAQSMCCRLSRDPAQVGRARKQAREALLRWGLAGHADLAELIVSELATNAIRHGDGVVHVCVSFARCDLRVEVHDDAAGRWPVRRQAAAEDESGRGLALLDGLIGLHGGCRGVTHDGTGRRKTVYVMICLANAPADPVPGGSGRSLPLCNGKASPRGHHDSHRAASRSWPDGLLPVQTRPRGAPCRTDALVRRAAPDRGHWPARCGPVK
jgi:anti-sigma regulatory factor (Ser/Thr protein kinase)